MISRRGKVIWSGSRIQMPETLIAVAIIISFPHTLFLFAVWPNEFLCRCWRHLEFAENDVDFHGHPQVFSRRKKNFYQLIHHHEFTVGMVFGPTTCSLVLDFFLKWVKEVGWPSDLWVNHCLHEANGKGGNLSVIIFKQLNSHKYELSPKRCL